MTKKAAGIALMVENAETTYKFLSRPSRAAEIEPHMCWNIWTCRGQTWHGAYTRVQGWWKRSSGLDTSNQRTWRSSGCRNCIPELVYLWNFAGNFCSVCIWMLTPVCHSLPQWAKSRTGLRLSKFEPHTRHPNFQHIENHSTILVSLATASDLEVAASSRCSLCKLIRFLLISGQYHVHVQKRFHARFAENLSLG